MDFDSVLAVCLDALRAGDSIEECLIRYPEHAAQLEPLLHTAAQLQVAAHMHAATPARLSDAAFERGRGALAQAACPQPTPGQPSTLPPVPARRPPAAHTWTFPSQQRRRSTLLPALVGVAAGLILVLGAALVLSTARGSLPGQALYGVKRVVEGAQGRLMAMTGQEAAWQARQLERRVGELATLSAVDLPVDAVVFDELQAQTAATLAAAETLPAEDRVAVLADVRDRLVEVQEGLAVDGAPAQAVDHVVEAVDSALVAAQTAPVAVAAADLAADPATDPAAETATPERTAAAAANATPVHSTITRATATDVPAASATATPAALAALRSVDALPLETATPQPEPQPAPAGEAAAPATLLPTVEPPARADSSPSPAATPTTTEPAIPVEPLAAAAEGIEAAILADAAAFSVTLEIETTPTATATFTVTLTATPTAADVSPAAAMLTATAEAPLAQPTATPDATTPTPTAGPEPPPAATEPSPPADEPAPTSTPVSPQTPTPEEPSAADITSTPAP